MGIDGKPLRLFAAVIPPPEAIAHLRRALEPLRAGQPELGTGA